MRTLKALILLAIVTGCSPITTCENPAVASYCGDLAGESVTVDMRAALLNVR